MTEPWTDPGSRSHSRREIGTKLLPLLWPLLSLAVYAEDLYRLTLNPIRNHCFDVGENQLSRSHYPAIPAHAGMPAKSVNAASTHRT